MVSVTQRLVRMDQWCPLFVFLLCFVASYGIKVDMEPAKLDCSGRSPLTQLKIQRTMDPLELKVGLFLVQYIPLVDGLLNFRVSNVNGRSECLMSVNSHVLDDPRAVQPSLFKYHTFTYIDHVTLWNCPGNFASLVYYLETHKLELKRIGLSRIYFIVLATDNQMASFYRLKNITIDHGDPDRFVRIIQTTKPIYFRFENPFQDPTTVRLKLGKDPNAIQSLPICQLSFPERSKLSSSYRRQRARLPTNANRLLLPRENENFRIQKKSMQQQQHQQQRKYMKFPFSSNNNHTEINNSDDDNDNNPNSSFDKTLDFLFHVRSVTLVGAVVTFVVVLAVLACLYCCWMSERRRRRLRQYSMTASTSSTGGGASSTMPKYKGLSNAITATSMATNNSSTMDYEKNYYTH